MGPSARIENDRAEFIVCSPTCGGPISLDAGLWIGYKSQMNTRPGSSGFMRRPDLWVALLVLLSTLALFWSATGYDFVLLDDPKYIIENPLVTGGLTWAGVQSAFGTMQESLWIPLTSLSYMLDVEVSGLKPNGFHFTNILLHALNAMLVFILLRRWTGSRWAACWAALIWAWHPLRVESVAWVSGRKDVLSGLLFLLCLLAYTQSFQSGSKSKRGFWASVGCLGLGLMAKPTLMVTPFLLLLLDFWPLQRVSVDWGDLRTKAPRLIAEKWPFWAMCIISGGLSIFGHDASGGLRVTSFSTRLAQVPLHVDFYLLRTLIPMHLSVLYSEMVVSGIRVALALLFLCGVTWLIWSKRKRWPELGVGWLWFLGLLIPVSGIVAFGAQSRADRYTYLPAIGLSLLLAVWVVRNARRKMPWVVAALLSLAFAGGLTHRQLPVWENSEALMEELLLLPSPHPVALLNYGVLQFSKGNMDKAEECYLQVVNLTPDRSLPAGNLGYVRVLQGRPEEAREALRPHLSDPYVHWSVPAAWGMSLLHEGRAREAIPYLEQSLRRRPGDRRLMLELQCAFFETGQSKAAREIGRNLARVTGETCMTYASLLHHYVDHWRHGARGYAWGYFERFVEKQPGNVQLLNNVAWLAATDEKTSPEIAKRAVVFAERAAELAKGTSASVLDTLGVVQASAGNFDAAKNAGIQAMALAKRNGDLVLAGEIRARVQLYRAGQPYRE